LPGFDAILPKFKKHGLLLSKVIKTSFYATDISSSPGSKIATNRMREIL
jgi:hypothetical protein